MSEPRAADAVPTIPAASELSAVTVLDAAGRRIGRLQDVYLEDATSRFSAISVALGRVGGRCILVPADAVQSLDPDEDGHIHLRVSADVVRSGRPAPDTLHADPAMLEEALRALRPNGDPQA